MFRLLVSPTFCLSAEVAEVATLLEVLGAVLAVIFTSLAHICRLAH